jgi:hypothetical protein
MDARTGAQRQSPSKPAWIVGGKSSSAAEQAVAVVDPVAAREPGPDAERVSLDPMRATDRYRLVMPYAEEV